MVRPYNQQQMMDALQKAYPEQHIKKASDFSEKYKGSTGIWMSAEDGTEDRKGNQIFDYYDDSDSRTFGVINHLNAFVERHGWYFEWYDAGTMMLWEI